MFTNNFRLKSLVVEYVLPFLSILLIIGRRKAAVLPLPVSAQVITSFFAAISFIALNLSYKNG